jgi:hypothetical protein
MYSLLHVPLSYVRVRRTCLKGHQVFFVGCVWQTIPYQRRALNAGKCGVEVEGGRLPTADWMLNLQILTSGGYQCAPAPPHH